MLLEMAEAVGAISETYPMIIFLEDLQWSDKTTLELIVMLARRRNSARMLIIATYRLEDVVGTEHPLPALKQELLVHRKCKEMTLQPLSVNGIKAYLKRRFTPVDGITLDLGLLAEKLHERTNGNPLFLTELLQHLIDNRYLAMEGDSWQVSCDLNQAVKQTPLDLQLFIDEQVNRLDPASQRILEMASLVGPQFSARLLTGMVDLDYLKIEGMCSQLAERDYMLAYSGERLLDDGSAVQKFRFVHNLHRETLHQRMPPAKRTRYLRMLGERIEELYPDDATAVYGELASLFERGKQYAKAVHYFALNADYLHSIGAEREARNHFARGSELVMFVRDPEERAPLEAALHQTRLRLYPGD